MSDTIGGLIDKMNTISLKTWNAQELIYKIRHMTFEEYKKEYFEDETGAEKLWKMLKKSCDLNLQRNQLIDEIDERLIELVNRAIAGDSLDDFVQRKHKTY
jgi:hypothetical protein